MGLYPDLPGPRFHAFMRDVVLLVWLVLFALLGLRVYHDVNKLTELGSGVVAAGQAVKNAFHVAASAAGSIPLAGSAISSALKSAGSSTGGGAVSIGRSSESSAHHLAVFLGVLIWALPSLMVLALMLPRRVRQVRRLRRLRLTLHGPDAEARRRLLATRALVDLPDDLLFAYTPDPAGDLLAGRYDALAAAALEANGLRAPASYTRG